MATIASKDTSFIRYWFCTIDSDVPINSVTSWEYVSNLIHTVLEHPNGWKKFGYKFQPIPVSNGLKLRNIQSMKKYIFHIRLSTDSTIQNICNFDKLSCADSRSNNIYLNVNNWIYGTKASELSPYLLRFYVVGHEFGHLLGKMHAECTNVNKPCSIMLQQTIKKKNCCKANIFPLQSDFDL